MSFSFRVVSSPDQLAISYDIQREVFQRELHCHGMCIPDRYDLEALYVHIVLSTVGTVGTYRLVLPTTKHGLPIQDTCKSKLCLPQGLVCEFSRLAVRKSFRGQVPFGRIIASVDVIARSHHASSLVGLMLLRNVPVFQRYGFIPVASPFYDPTVDSSGKSNVVPMVCCLES